MFWGVILNFKEMETAKKAVILSIVLFLLSILLYKLKPTLCLTNL